MSYAARAADGEASREAGEAVEGVSLGCYTNSYGAGDFSLADPVLTNSPSRAIGQWNL